MSPNVSSNNSQAFLRLPFAAQRRRARPALVALWWTLKSLLFVLPVAALVFWLLTSPVFALRSVVVAGTARAEAAWVEEGLSRFRGRNLMRLDLAEVQRQLESHEWIRGVDVRKLLPDRLRVQVVEHQPYALLVTASDRYFLDQWGRVITNADESEDDWLVIKMDSSEPMGAQMAAAQYGADFWVDSALPLQALELARSLAGSLPGRAHRVREVEVLTPGDFRVELEGLGFPLLVRQETAIDKIRLLERLLPQLEERLAPIRAVDLRFSRRILIKPAVRDQPGSQKG